MVGIGGNEAKKPWLLEFRGCQRVNFFGTKPPTRWEGSEKRNRFWGAPNGPVVSQPLC